MAERSWSPGAAISQAMQIASEQWEAFLDDFTRRNRGAHATVETLGGDAGHQVQVEGRALDGIAADVKGNRCAVWMSFASTTEDHIAHGISQVTAIYWRGSAGRAGEALEIESQDGTKTILELTRPEDFALPGEGS